MSAGIASLLEEPNARAGSTPPRALQEASRTRAMDLARVSIENSRFSVRRRVVCRPVGLDAVRKDLIRFPRVRHREQL
jgi:enterochelin esterase-like enzyme